MVAATATETQKAATITAWKMELLQSLADLGVPMTTNVHDLRAYNDARDQFARWLSISDSSPLKTKEQWTFGFVHLFNLCAAVVTLKFGAVRGSVLRQELVNEFHKSGAIVDVASEIGRAHV